MTTRHTSRKRFPKWLRELVDKQEVYGVYWLDKEKRTFRVPWTRVDSPEFDLPRDAMLFQKWAEFTGRYRRGERTDPSVWKTRFRCAIRKMTEIEEIKMDNNLDDSNGQQPFRVFRFKSEEESQSKKEIKRKYGYRTDSRGMVKSRHSTPLVYHGQIRRTSSRQIKQDVVLGHGVTQSVTQSMTQSLTSGNDFAALGVTNIDSTLAPSGMQQCMMQNRKTVRVNSGMAGTQSPSDFGFPDVPMQKAMPGFTSSTCDVNYFLKSTLGNTNTNFEMNVTQCAGSNALYHSNDVTATFVNTPWPNHTGTDRGNTIQGACEPDLLNFPKISLQEVNNILLDCTEPSFMSGCTQAKEGELTGVPCTTDRMTPYNGLQSSFEDDRSNKGASYHNGQMFEDQGCEEAKAYNNSLILNDLNEILARDRVPF